MPYEKKISYTDLDGNQVVDESWWFSLEKHDLIDLPIAFEDNPGRVFQDIVESEDPRRLLEMWRMMLFASVAKREGRSLVKGPEIVNEFRGSGAYGAIFNSLIEDPKAGWDMFVEMFPADIQERAHEEANRTYTNEELLAMSDSDFYAAAGTKDIQNMDKRFLQIAFQRKSNVA